MELGKVKVKAERLKVKEGKLMFGDKEIKYIPEESKLKDVKEIGLKKVNERPVYEIARIKRRKLLGFISIDVEYREEIEAEEGKKIAERKPFFDFLLTD